jgi:tetratricopeptide (TPR) repeat protein
MRLLLAYSLLISLYSSDAFGPINTMRPGQGVLRTTEQNNILFSTIDDNKEKIRADSSTAATTEPFVPTSPLSTAVTTNTNNNVLPFQQPKQKQNQRKPHIITTSTTTTTKTVSRTVSTYSKHSTSSTFIDLKQGDNKNILDTSPVVSDTSVSPTINSSSSIPSTETDTSGIEDKITYDDDEEVTTMTTVAQYSHVHHIEDNSNDVNDTTNEVVQEQEEPPVQPPQLQKLLQKQDEPVLFSEKQLLEQCLEQQTFSLGPTHVDTMKTLYNLANYMYGHDDNKEEALKLFHVCYHQQSFALGQNHPDTVLTLNRLVSFYLDNNDDESEKENRYEIAKDLLSTVNGLILNHDILATNHEYVPHQMDVMTLDTLLKLAFAYHRIGDIDNAMELYESYVFHCAVDESNSTTNVTPTNHHNIRPSPEDKLSAQHNLGVLYQNQGLYNMAKPLIEECYTQRRDILGDDHPLTLGTMNNLAALLHKCGDYEDALRMYEDCLDVKNRSLGKEHPDTLLTFRNLQRLKDVFVE